MAATSSPSSGGRCGVALPSAARRRSRSACARVVSATTPLPVVVGLKSGSWNTRSGGRELPREEGFACLLGAELTTFRGHAVCTGITAMPEWRDLERRGVDALAREVHAQGGLFTIAHPLRLGSPLCSGCTWEW